MKPTALGLKASLFYLLLLGAFFAAPYANHFFLLLVFLTVLGLLSVLWGARNVAGLRGRVQEIEPSPAETGPPVRTLLEGRGRALCVELDLEGHGTVTVLGERGRLPALPRGVYRVAAARAVSTWPLGLVRFSRPLAAPEEIVVYPLPASLMDAAGRAGELCAQLGAPDGMLQPSGLREFRAGDEMRRVHWKASARRGDLVVAEWEGGRGDGAEVWLDLRCEPRALEQSLGILSALAQAAREDKQTLTLHAQGLSATFGQELKPWRELLRFLAAAQPLPATAPAPPPASPTAARLPR